MHSTHKGQETNVILGITMPYTACLSASTYFHRRNVPQQILIDWIAQELLVDYEESEDKAKPW